MLTVLQIIVSIIVVVLILLQERSSGLSGILGGGSEFYHVRRGLEKTIFYMSIAFIVIFAGLSLANLLR